MESESIQNSSKYYVASEIHQEQYRMKSRGNNQPSKRWGHTCVLYRHYLYLFGGNTSHNYHQSSHSLYSFDLKNWGDTCWEKYLPNENETCPSLRDSHTATVIDNTMFIICGRQNDISINEVFAFDFRSQSCKKLGLTQRDTEEPSRSRTSGAEGFSRCGRLQPAQHHLDWRNL